MNRPALVIALFAGSLILTQCTSSPQSGDQSDNRPSQVHPIAGTNTSRVVLTQRAAGKLGIMTAEVKASSGSGTASRETTVPTAAIVYDAAGNAWVYTTNPTATPDPIDESGIEFQRQPVTVSRINGQNAQLKSGPPPGTHVVIVGAQELLGTENGVEGGSQTGH